MRRSTQLLLLSAFRRRIGSLWEDRDYDTIVRLKHIHVFMFSMVGLFVMVATQLAVWSLNSTGNRFEDAYVDDPTLSATLVNVLYLSQAVISSSTLITAVLITQKYRLLLTMKRAEWSGAHLTEVEDVRGDTVLRTNEREQFTKSYSFWTGEMKWMYLFEIVIHLPHPIIWMSTADSETDPKNVSYKLLQTYMFLRLYLAPTILHLRSPAFIKRFEIVTHDPALRSVGYKIRQALTLKIFFYQHTAIFVLGGFIGLIMAFGFMEFTMERKEGTIDPAVSDGQFSSYWNCLWFAFITAATVGYGEYAPGSTLGRIVASLCLVIGVSLFTVFSGVLVSRVSLSKEQKHGVEFIATRRGDERYREAARRLRTVFLMDVCMPVWDKSWDNRDVYMTRHKGNRLHQAVTGLRAARRELNGAFMEADDTVVNEKIEALEELMHAIEREVGLQQESLVAFDQETQQRIRGIIQKVSHYKRERR
jgi:hypothetical protein